MQLVEYSDAQSFLRAAGDYMLAEEAQNNLLLSSVLSLARSSAGRIPHISYFTLQDRSHVSCAGLNVSHRKLILSHADSTSALCFGELLGKRDETIRAVLAPTLVAADFSRGFANAGGAQLTSSQNLRQLALRAGQIVAALPSVDGLWRTARDKDSRFLYQWTRDFVTECQHDETPQESRELITRYIENRQLFIWENQAGPVAMAGFSGHTPSGVRINMVYTEPKSRGRGYAGALVSVLHRKLLTQGDKKFCFLFVDSQNETAQRVYQRLGYQNIGQFADYRIVPHPQKNQTQHQTQQLT